MTNETLLKQITAGWSKGLCIRLFMGDSVVEVKPSRLLVPATVEITETHRSNGQARTLHTHELSNGDGTWFELVGDMRTAERGDFRPTGGYVFEAADITGVEYF